MPSFLNYSRLPHEPVSGWLKKRLRDERNRSISFKYKYGDKHLLRTYRNGLRTLKGRLGVRLQSIQRGRQVRKLYKGYNPVKHGLVYNPYTKRQVRYTKPTIRMVYNPYAKTHTKIKIGKPTSRLIYNPYSKTYSKHECRSPLCGCS